MVIEQAINVLSILLNMAGLMLCLFRYFEHTRRTLSFAVIFYLGNMLSNYYWGVYCLVMNDDPVVSDMLAYFGWNLSFVMLTLMLVCLRRERGIRKFSLISFLPIPIAVAQLILYLQYGGIFNNLWQVSWATASACLALNTIDHCLNERSEGKKTPLIECVVLLYIISEFASWTASCFDWPSELLDPYTYMSLLGCVCYLLLPLAFAREYGKNADDLQKAAHSRLMRLFRPLYTVVLVVCCSGGYFLAVWIRNTLEMSIGGRADANPYSIIAAMLFVVSLVIVSFTLTIILVVESGKKTYEGQALEAARDSAERSNEAKSEFLANMSHEIRTPINAVLGMNEMIFRESLEARDDPPGDPERIRELFSDICLCSGNIESAGRNLLSIINDILDFSKIEAGKLEIVEGDYQLSAVLNDVSNMISFKAENKGLKYDVVVDETLPDGFRGDEIRVRQIITNLLNNAVKYTEKGKFVLSVSGKRGPDKTDADHMILMVSVRDTGIGIKEEDRARLFKKFERMDIEKNSTIEGTGLGLAITGSLLEMMGGSIEVDSRYGRGSTFTAYIPQEVTSAEPIGNFRERYENSIRAQKARKESFHAENAHILIVDDTELNLAVAKGLLKKTQIAIDTATGGEAAIRLARESRYDLILMDQRMPEMDGTTAMRKIKEDPNSLNGKTPFICLTADAITGARERYIAEGFNDYLTKPIDGASLEKVLLQYLPEAAISSRDSAGRGAG
ncbi:MAG: response regulator [Lachnospiraceae bacterium]|nr:response regulator [Lachnospiraceae bacterium]